MREEKDLRHSVSGRGRLFSLVGVVDRMDKIDRMVVGNELQRVGNAVYEIVLLDSRHVVVPGCIPNMQRRAEFYPICSYPRLGTPTSPCGVPILTIE